MLKTIKKSLSELTDSEKLEICFVTILISSAVILILLAIATSRGNDVDYFKERILNLEQRFIVAEKARDSIQLRITEEEKKSLELNTKVNETQIRVQETERWIEEFNRLPQLPKPKPPRHPPPQMKPIN